MDNSENDDLFKPSSPAPRRRQGRGLPDLSDLFSDSDTQKTTEKADPKPTPVVEIPPVEPHNPSEVEPIGETSFPPELEHYLSADLWRKLNGQSPRRGVLINALERLRSVQYLFSTFLPSHLVQERMRRPVAGLVSGQVLRGSLLFSDVSGFTALSERLAVLGPEGAERLTEIMNRYFTTMLEIISWSGGTLLKFAGDAALVYFPQQEQGAQARWAVRAGTRMLHAIEEFSNIPTPTENVSLKMKIGVASGEFLAASVGSARRMEYGVIGPAVTQTMGAEGASTGPGQLIVNETTTQLLGDEFTVSPQAPGYFLAQAHSDQSVGDFEIKAEERRARSGVPWNASPQALLAQMRIALNQIHALEPFIAAELAERVIVHARERRVESEFLLTTVLFCNFIGFETLFDAWGQAGVSRLTSLLSAYFTAMNEAIIRYGGIVTRIDPYSKGTKLLAVFGAPVSHEDDPQRAVSAALAMNVELEALNERWRTKFARYIPADWEGPLVRHRIGITQGSVYAGMVGSSTRREYTVMGDDVNLSARLMGAAKPGQILVSQSVYTAVSDYFLLTELPSIRVKGKSRPIPLHQVDGAREDTLANRVHKRPPIVGREGEWTRARRFLQNALQGQCVYLSILGAPGIGKSYLADILLQEAENLGARLLLHQCRSYRATTNYACLSGILRTLASISPTDIPHIQQAKLRRHLTDMALDEQQINALESLLGLHITSGPAKPNLPGSEDGPVDDAQILRQISQQGRKSRQGKSATLLKQLEVGHPTDLGGQTWLQVSPLSSQEQHRLAEAFVALLSGLLSKGPLVLFFEDAHWMDPLSLDLLMRAQPQLQNQPLLVLTAQRGEGSRQTKQWETVSLKPFSQADTSALVAHILVSDLVPLIQQQSTGNPLFVSEISHWIKTTRKISAEDLGKVLTESNILQKLALSSLESLTELQREIARVASVIGDEFRLSQVLALMQSKLDPVTLSNNLSALLDTRVITLLETGVDALYTFQQSLVREVLYNSLPFARRRQIHAQIAEHLSAPRSQRSELRSRIAAFLDTGSTANAAQEEAIIAGHYMHAEQWLPAAQHFFLAGDHSSQRQDTAQAATFLQHGLDAINRIPAGQTTSESLALSSRIQAALGDACVQNEDLGPAAAAYEAANTLLPENTPPPDALKLRGKLALLLISQNRPEDAEKLLLQLLTSEPGTAELGLTAALAWLHWRSEKSEAASYLKRCQLLLPTITGHWVTGIEILVNDLAGQWAAVKAAYLAYNLPVGAALAAIRLGDQFLRQSNSHLAQGQYQHAAQIWSKLPGADCGLALIGFRQAEASWIDKDTSACQAALEKAQKHLEGCIPAIQVEGRDLFKQALKIIRTGKPDAWPGWHWRPVDDQLRIQLLSHAITAS